MSRATIAFLFVLGLALTSRLIMALTWDGYWGVDGGASILNVNYVLGDEPTGTGFPKPPLAPGWTLAPFILLMGVDVGYKVYSAVFAILPIIPVYLITRRHLGAWPAVGTALFACVDWTWGEMFATGSHPLTAFAMVGLAWYLIGERAEEKNTKWAHKNLIIIASIGLIPWLNQTTAALAMMVLPAYFFALCWFKRSWLMHVMKPCVIGGLLGLGALPWYMQTLPGSELLTYDGPMLYWAWGLNTVQGFLIALPLGVFAIWKAQDARLRALGIVLLVFAALLPWLSFDEVIINPPYRSRYMMALAFYPVMAWVVFVYWIPAVARWWDSGWPSKRGRAENPTDHSPMPREEWPVARKGSEASRATSASVRRTVPLFILLSAVAFVYMASIHHYAVLLQASISEMVSPETAVILERLRSNEFQDNAQTPQAKPLARGIASNAFSLSLWISALNKVPSPFLTTAPPPPAYRDSDTLLRCSFGWVSGCNGSDAASELGIRYLLVEERFPHYSELAPGNYMAPDNQWAVTANAPWLDLVYSAGTTRLYEVQKPRDAS